MAIAALLFIVAVAAFALSAVSGGGAGLMILPVLGLLLAPAQVPAALSVGTALSALSRILSFFRSIRWDVVVRFVPPALPAAWGGVWMLSRLQPVYLDLLLGLFLIGNLPLLLRRGGGAAGAARPVRPALLPALGAAAGFVSGFTGAVGLLFNGFYHRMGLQKEQIVATRAANDVLLHLTKLGLYLSYGMLTGPALRVGLVVAAAAIAATLLVRAVIHRLHDALFRHVGHAAACAAGVAMLVQAGQQITRQDHMAARYAVAGDDVEAALVWRQHVFSIEVESPVDIEFRHIHPAFGSGRVPRQGNGWYRTSVLHLSPAQGIFVTRRLSRAAGLSTQAGGSFDRDRLQEA
ncbi:sulfite exporter TauE/SafE family protein [Gluconacetobacter takamatsuzukensis]|uniref:Probable membrane transporter protein n=1 Tax=Gluconacetobacter takamatsuzukensis TaxID=1286190 RepID=A0A7W4PP89_9PROT|nr:sulfite exporter TauE/SafE family protein [Gluconacetobacter takamatsuzukensis]MBB2205387.1 sulfite exporter TauE/SafE family protein [Gluconacetobacter takamatsuzukensis]